MGRGGDCDRGEGDGEGRGGGGGGVESRKNQKAGVNKEV